MGIGRNLVLCAALLALAGCSSNGDDDGGSGGAGGTGGTGGTGGSGGTAGRTCTTTNQCPAGELCDPAAGVCTTQTLTCEAHADCGRAAFCNDAGQCERNDTGGPCDVDERCRPGESCTGGFCGCQGDQFVAEAVPPNVLIMLDRSGSMDDPVGGQAKWDIAISAIEGLLAEYGSQIRFGLMLYPWGGRSCGAGSVRVDVGDGTAQAILAELAATSPSGSTPIGFSLDAVLDYPGLEDPERSNFVLLITDGDETCRGDGTAAVTALRSQTPEVRTFVVGFGGEVDATELSQMAVAGGTALPGTPQYYQADDAASLAAAFASIGGEVLSCSYELSGTPESADDIFIYFDGVSVARDPTHAAGWDYDPQTNQVTFFGADCQKLRDGSVVDLVIVNGCPIVIG